MRQIIQREKLVMLTLFSTTCSACRMQDKILEKLTPSYGGKMRFLKMDIQVNPSFAARHQIYGVPVTKFILNEQLVKFKSKRRQGRKDTPVGFRDKKTIEGILNHLLSLN